MTQRGRPRKPLNELHDIRINLDYYYRKLVRQPTGCIEYRAGRHRQGYGMCGAWRTVDGHRIMTTTHRIAARIAFDRALDPDEFVIHTCSNMNCMNPDHLIIGDRHDMQRVMRTNHRHRPGGRNPYPAK